MAGEYVEEIIEEVVDDDEPKPGLLVLDMLNENLENVTYNKKSLIANCRQLAMSDFFHVCIDSNPVVPKFRANSKGAQLVDELNSFDHFNHIPKKNNSALDGTAVLETLRSVGITHVCVCGTSAELSVLETVRDLKRNEFEVFVVKDAISSKNGKAGYDAGITKIRSEFGGDLLVGISDLIGEEEVVEEEVVEEVVEKAPAVAAKSPSGAPAAAPAKKAPAPSPAPAKTTPSQTRSAPAPAKNDSGGGLFGCCSGSAVEDSVAKQPDKTSAPAPAPAAAPVAQAPAATKAPPKPAPSPAAARAPPASAPAPSPAAQAPAAQPTAPASAPAAAPAPSQSNVRSDPKPGWATAEKSGTGAPASAPVPSGNAPAVRPAKNVPAGFVSGTRKDQDVSAGVQDRIAGLKASGLKTQNTGGKRMKTPRIITDTKESWDREGNITREITRYITEPDGSKRTEKETVYIPAGQAEQQ